MSTLRIERVAHGGEGIGRLDGKTVFVHGAVPGDLVNVEITESKKRYDRGWATEILEPSSDRTIPLCRHTDVCGGCTWQFVDYQAQLAWKREIVASQLRHLGKLDIEVPETEAVSSPYHYRNRMDYVVADGRLALHRRASHQLVALQECRLVVEPLAHVVSAASDLAELGGTGRRVTLRAGVNTGEMLAVVDEPLDGLPIAQAHPGDAVLHEVVAGVRLKISGRSFFQGNTAGAERLVTLVGEALGSMQGRHLADVYAGVGLFGATVGSNADRVVALEVDRRAIGDLEVNLPGAEIVEGPVEKTIEKLVGPIDAVVVDPPRTGLGAKVVSVIAALHPDVVASVSCDPATFARDAKLFTEAGYTMSWLRPLDLFPHTPHIEIVARFERST